MTAFTETLLDKPVAFQVIELKDSFFVWLGPGGGTPTMEHLAAAMMTPFDRIASQTTIVGTAGSNRGSDMARRLAQRTKVPCFVSYNLGDTSRMPMLEDMIEARVAKELKRLMADS